MIITRRGISKVSQDPSPSLGGDLNMNGKALSGALDGSALTSLKVPVSAGAAPTANGQIAYDSTANAFKFGANGVTRTHNYFSTTDGGAPVAPKYAPFTAFKTAMDMKSTGNGATIFTVPAGVTGFVLINAAWIVDAINAPVAAAFRYNITSTSGSMSASVASGSQTPAVGQNWSATAPSNNAPWFTALTGTAVTVTITTPFTGTTVTGTMFLTGFYY